MRLSIPKCVGFTATTSMNCDGKVIVSAAREMVKARGSKAAKVSPALLKAVTKAPKKAAKLPPPPKAPKAAPVPAAA